MSNRAETRHAGAATGSGALPVIAALGVVSTLLVLASLAHRADASVETDEDRSAFDAASALPAASAPGASQPPGYSLRCWQDGRLIIDERSLDLGPAGSAAVAPALPPGSLRLQAKDARRRLIYLTETRNATCLLRPAEALPGR